MMDTPIPLFNQPFMDPRTGMNSREWYRYFDNLVNNLVPVAGGNVDLVGGTVLVFTPFANSADEYVYTLTVRQVAGTQGLLRVSNIVDDTRFEINSTSATDTSRVSWAIFKQVTG